MPKELFSNINPNDLPTNMEVEIMLDIGENSNASRVNKLTVLGGEILPTLKDMGAGLVAKPEAAAAIATQMIDALGLNPADYLKDYTTDEFKQEAQAAEEEAQKQQAEITAIEKQKVESEIALAEANVLFTNRQADNALQDNMRQTAVAIDEHHQKWADLAIKAEKDGLAIPEKPEMGKIFDSAMETVNAMTNMESPVEEFAEGVQEGIQQVTPGPQ